MNRISFNINVDAKTFKKIKQAEKNAKDIARGIKNNEQMLKTSKKNNPASINQVAIPGGMGMQYGMGPIGAGMLSPAGMLGQNKGMMMPPLNMGSMGSNFIPQMGGMNNMAPQIQEGNPKTKL